MEAKVIIEGKAVSIATLMAGLTDDQLKPMDTPENRKAIEKAWANVSKAMEINSDLKRIQNEP